MSESPFSRRAIRVLVVVTGVSLLTFLVLLAFGPELAPVDRAAPDSFSTSALGHRALVEMLRAMDVPVTISRGRTARRLAEGSVLLVLEPPDPRVDSDEYDSIREMLAGADRALVALPKRKTIATKKEGRWAQWSDTTDTGEVDSVLEELDVEGFTRRPETITWTQNDFAVEPTVDTLQVIASSNLTPVIDTDQGVVLGRVPDPSREIWVLSDPDILATHGLGRGRNAELAYRIVERLRDGTGEVVVDETHHGYTTDRSLWAELFRFPLVLVMLHLAIALGVLLWSALERFGGVRRAPPAIGRGTDALIENTAELLRRGRHAPRMLERYHVATRRAVAEALHAPRHLEPAERAAWLEEVGNRRGVTITLASLETDVANATRSRRFETGRVTGAARRIHRWKTEIRHARPDRRS